MQRDAKGLCAMYMRISDWVTDNGIGLKFPRPSSSSSSSSFVERIGTDACTPTRVDNTHDHGMITGSLYKQVCAHGNDEAIVTYHEC